MNLIQHLSRQVTPIILDHQASQTGEEPIREYLMLEQFYAISLKCLADLEAPHVLDKVSIKTLWGQDSQRQQLIIALAKNFYLKVQLIEQLVTQALPQLYKVIWRLSQERSQTIAAVVESDWQNLVRYIPPWAAPFIGQLSMESAVSQSAPASSGAVTTHSIKSTDQAIESTDPSAETKPLTPLKLNKEISGSPQTLSDDVLVFTDHHHDDSSHSKRNQKEQSALKEERSKGQLATEQGVMAPSHRITKPSASLRHINLRYINKTSSLLGSLMIAVLILAVLAWLGFQLYLQAQKKPQEPVQPRPQTIPKVTSTTTAQITPKKNSNKENRAMQAYAPVTLTLKMDVDQSVYMCSAKVGDKNAQAALLSSLTSVLNKQASVCKIKIDPAVSVKIPALPNLAKIISIVRSVPFATLQLQKTEVSLSAPNPQQLMQIQSRVQAIDPTLKISTLAPLAIDNARAPDLTTDSSKEHYNQTIATSDSSEPLASIRAEDQAEQGEAQLALAGASNPNLTGSNDTPSAADPNTHSLEPQAKATASDDLNTTTDDLGQISTSELEEMANTIIIAEP